MHFRFLFPRLLVIGVLLLGLGEARAQSQPPPQRYQPPGPNLPPPQPDLFEASIGFSYLYADKALAKNMYGGDVSLFLNLLSWLSVGGQFIGEYGEKDHFVFNRNTTFDEDRLFYVAGPRVNVWNRDNLKVFVEGMAGGAHGRVSASIFGVDRHASADGFAALVGAGAEWKFSRRLAWRIIETDYIPAHLGGEWENDWRVSTGVSFMFGAGW
jgi:hypothetical protein